MTTIANSLELSALVKMAEESVVGVKDEGLKRIAFEKVLQSLLAGGGKNESVPHVGLPLPSERPRLNETKNRISSIPSIVRGLNLRPTENESLRDFCTKKAPKTNQEIVTVIIYYLQHVLGTNGITPNHVYTGYKEVGAKIPTALVQLLRDASCRKGWINTSDICDLRTEIHGENLVEHDLPRSQKPR